MAEKANAALIPVINYFWPLDLFTAALCVGVPVLCLAFRWCTIPFQAACAIAVVLGLFAGMPTGFKGTSDLDVRFIVMAAFMLPAAIASVALPRRVAQSIGIAFVFLFGARMTLLMTVWDSWSAELTAFRTVIAPIQPGDVVMTVRVPRGGDPNIWSTEVTARRLSNGASTDSHLPALLVIEHRAWWPFLFDNLSQQPIEKREPYRNVAELIDNSPDPIGLLTNDAAAVALITHVLVLGPEPTQVATAGLKLLAENREAALFAVVRDVINQERPRSPPSDR